MNPSDHFNFFYFLHGPSSFSAAFPPHKSPCTSDGLICKPLKKSPSCNCRRDHNSAASLSWYCNGIISSSISRDSRGSRYRVKISVCIQHLQYANGLVIIVKQLSVN